MLAGLVLFDTFVFRKVEVENVTAGGIYADAEENINTNNSVTTNRSYKDDNISINITEQTLYNTQVYIADIRISSVTYLKTALAGNSYGRNIQQTTSEMAEENNAILAINGDYYGFRNYGYVEKNGVLYRKNTGICEFIAGIIINVLGRIKYLNTK